MLFDWPRFQVCVYSYDALCLMNAAGVKCFCSSLLEIELRCYDVSWCLMPPFSVCLGYGKPFYPQMTLSKNDTIQNRFWTCAVEAVVDFSRVYIRMVDDCALLQHILWLSQVGPLWYGWSLLAVTHRIRSGSTSIHEQLHITRQITVGT